MKRMLKARVDQILAEGLQVRLSPAERNALVEIAFLAMAADGLIRDEEVEAFTEAMRVLIRPDAERDQVRNTVEYLVDREEWLDSGERLKEVAANLSMGFAREQAYKIGLLMTLSDFDTNPAESEFEESLRCALELSQEESARLSDEVFCAVSADRPA